MVEKEFGERNFGFDSLKSRLNRDMEDKGIVARDCLPTELRCLLPTAPPAGLRRETIPGNNLFLLHVMVQSVLQIDVEVEEPEMS